MLIVSLEIGISVLNTLYYFIMGRSLGNNRPARSPKKKNAPKGKANKGKGKSKADEPADHYCYKK